jgi:hypothetical protein
MQSHKPLAHISNMWGDYIGIQTTDKNELIIDLRPYKKEKFIHYKVISADCFESELKSIHIE